MAQTNSVSCGICKSDNASILYRKKDYSIAHCHSCGVRFTVPQPAYTELRQLYSKAYYRPWNLEQEAAVKKIKMETFEKRLREIQVWEGSGCHGRILDVGCATGFFLEKAQSLGFEPYGIELSEFSFEKARSKFGDSIFYGTIEESPFENNFFDVITMFDLLEHVKDPVETLRRCRAILKPQGIIVAVLPDVSSITAKLMGKNWTHHKKEHLYYFSKKTIAELLRQESYEVVKIAPARKVMNLGYVYHQFTQYSHHIITPLITTFYKLLPHNLCNISFQVTMGEMLVIARSATKRKE